jgi:sporulation protein YlmC with PRC-barrel domain
MRTSELLGRTAYDSDGQELGRIADLLAHRDADGVYYVHSVLVVPRRRGRLFGYERDGVQGPWLIERIAELLHRGAREIPWTEVRLS